MKKILKHHTISFKNAICGVVWAIKTQPNFRIHFILSLLAIGGGFYYQISYFEWLIILVMIFLGLTVEMINTAIESTTDAIDHQWREEIKIAKDVAAGAMLIVAVGALVVAVIIFLPKII